MEKRSLKYTHTTKKTVIALVLLKMLSRKAGTAEHQDFCMRGFFTDRFFTNISFDRRMKGLLS
jgi:hypothetical protein